MQNARAMNRLLTMNGFRFFFTSFHTGAINLTLHLISFGVMYVGSIEHNVILFLIGWLVINECGHIYNYFFLHRRDNPLFNPLRMLPYQIVLGLPATLLLLKVFHFI